jgi:hypothetical protein
MESRISEVDQSLIDLKSEASKLSLIPESVRRYSKSISLPKIKAKKPLTLHPRMTVGRNFHLKEQEFLH